jgi:hypothetical protein
MSTLTQSVIEEICQRGTISDADVQRLRRMIYGEAAIIVTQAEQLFRMNAAIASPPASWKDFFVEALTDYAINEAEPRGYITLANAKWLIDCIGKFGKADSRLTLELVINIIEKSRWVPETLVKFALETVKTAIVTGSGELRVGSDAKGGQITDGEVDLLRRIIYAFGGDGMIAVTRAEAEVLFDINAAVAEATIAPAFTDLFVKATLNAMMAASGYAVPSREIALKAEAFPAARGDVTIDGVIASMTKSPMLAIYKEQSSEERAIARLERQRIEIITNEEVTQGEVDWLVERLSRDGKLTPNEQALVAVLKRENPQINPAFAPALLRLRKAA